MTTPTTAYAGRGDRMIGARILEYPAWSHLMSGDSRFSSGAFRNSTSPIAGVTVRATIVEAPTAIA